MHSKPLLDTFNPNIMWKCPDCEEEIEELYYTVPIVDTESGTAYLLRAPTPEQLEARERYTIITEHDYSDSNGSEWDGSPEYECPHCGSPVDIEDLIWCDDDEEELDEDGEPIAKVDEEPEETKFNIIKPKNHITETDNHGGSLSATIICKECNHPFVTDMDRWGGRDCEFFDCPKCGTQNSTTEFRKLLNEGFFNQITAKKHVTTKKVKPGFLATLGKSRRAIHS